MATHSSPLKAEKSTARKDDTASERKKYSTEVTRVNHS